MTGKLEEEAQATRGLFDDFDRQRAADDSRLLSDAVKHAHDLGALVDEALAADDEAMAEIDALSQGLKRELLG